MYSKFYSLVEKLERGDGRSIAYQPRDKNLVIGVLLYLVIQADGRVRKAETSFFREVLTKNLGIMDGEVSRFENRIKRLVKSDETINILVSELRKSTHEEKREVLQFLHNMSISDKEFHELEFNFVAKIRTLIDFKDD